MTQEQLTGLAILLMEFRDWVEYTTHAPLDTVTHIDDVIDVIGIYRALLVSDGA